MAKSFNNNFNNRFGGFSGGNGNGRRPSIRLDGRCPICSHNYDFRRLKILGEREQEILTYIDCHHCGGAILSILTISPLGLSATGLLTDLGSDEVLDEDSRRTVTGDDVLDLHTALDREDAYALDLIST
ncbi:MAG: hypothetical protein HYZ09_04180 [Candidatus Kerfeldbacteria bacterium]|nr:hypothetical protein [Candidatus Kerfeldbacteria bacterium]